MHHRLRYPSAVPLQSSVDAYMTGYAALEARKAQDAKRLRQEPDEEGFITVTRGGRNGPARQEDAQAAAERQKKKADGELKHFYRFQRREERKKAQGELLRQFEDDRRKLQEMKRRRTKFRVSDTPFVRCTIVDFGVCSLSELYLDSTGALGSHLTKSVLLRN